MLDWKSQYLNMTVIERFRQVRQKNCLPTAPSKKTQKLEVNGIYEKFGSWFKIQRKISVCY